MCGGPRRGLECLSGRVSPGIYHWLGPGNTKQRLAGLVPGILPLPVPSHTPPRVLPLPPTPPYPHTTTVHHTPTVHAYGRFWLSQGDPRGQ